MIVFLVPNLQKPAGRDFAGKVVDFLQSRDVTVAANAEEAAVLGLAPLEPTHVDFVVSMGGDGTMLRAAHGFPYLEAPIVGINMGSLGFLADIPLEATFSALEKILEGNFFIQERLLLVGACEDKASFAVNEIVIHRSGNPRLIDLAVYVDDLYLNTFSADGLIIATPGGSTAYSLAAGGPIVAPDLEAIVITPICPHAISNRPIVLMPKQEIRVQYLSRYEPIELIFDGIPEMKLVTGSSLTIHPGKERFRLVTFADIDYFTTLRTKLGWTGTLRN